MPHKNVLSKKKKKYYIHSISNIFPIIIFSFTGKTSTGIMEFRYDLITALFELLQLFTLNKETNTNWCSFSHFLIK